MTTNWDDAAAATAKTSVSSWNVADEMAAFDAGWPQDLPHILRGVGEGAALPADYKTASGEGVAMPADCEQ